MDIKTSKDIIVGAKFGRWTVLQTNTLNPNCKAKHPPKMALCECECGQKRYKEYRDLYSGRSLSCGCLRNEQTVERNKKNSSVLVGNQYGFLTVIKDLGYHFQARGKRESWYLCECSNCGNKNYKVNGNNLQAGTVKSCGCISSYGEKIIKQILLENKIQFEQQYKFKDLVSLKGGLLRFDFAVFRENGEIDFLIEFDGRQHFLGPEAKWKDSYTLEEQQCRDRLKEEYCQSKNLKLKRIPYYKKDEISLSSLLDDTFTVKKNS